PRETSVPIENAEIGPSTEQNKIILIYKNISNDIEFYTDNSKIIIEAYKRINEESEAIAEKTNRQVDISKKIDEKENAWLNLASTGALVFAEKYEGEANQYDKFNGIYKATIEGNPLKKSLQCTRYLRYNPHGIYTHYDLEYTKKNDLKVYLMNESPNALIYEKKLLEVICLENGVIYYTTLRKKVKPLE
ncbi:12214_t:CDS:2, partial [Ambispora leptoticha]